MKHLIAVAALCAGCVTGLDPEWQLDHDHLVVVRATPPHIPPGATATLDALVAHKGATTDVEQALALTVISPSALAEAVVGTQVIAPDAATLANERMTLNLPPDAPVPLVVGAEFPPSNGHTLAATKVVWLGDDADNPAMPAITVAGQAPGAAIAFPIGVDVPLATDVDATWAVDWLTSVGTMHDDNEHVAFDHVDPPPKPALDLPETGELATVIRDAQGGVVWQVWPLTAQ